MMTILMAAGVMVGASLAQHLGLTEAVAKVIGKIASCPMCCTFWLCVFVLSFIEREPIHYSFLLSICAAYASHWFVLILLYLQQKYNELWQRLTRK